MADRTDDLVVDVLDDAVPAHHLAVRAVPDAEKFVRTENQQGHGLFRNLVDRSE